MQVYGIDLSMEKFDVNYIDENGKERKKRSEKQVKFHIEVFGNSLVRCHFMCREHWDLQRYVGLPE